MVLTQAILKELVHYDPLTGLFTWLPRSERWFKDFGGKHTTKACQQRWNTRYAHKPAFDNINCGGYLVGTLFGKQYKSHRIAWLYMTGEWPNQIDHINWDKSDNRFDNLRNVDSVINAQNQKLPSNNTSGYKGVCWHKGNKKWMAAIKFFRKPEFIGYYNTPEEAYEAFCNRAKEIGYTDRHIGINDEN